MKYTTLEQIRQLFNHGLTGAVTIFALVVNILFGVLQLYNERSILNNAGAQSTMIDERSYYRHIQVIDSQSPLAQEIQNNSIKWGNHLYLYANDRYLVRETSDLLLLRGINHLHQRQFILLIVSLILIVLAWFTAKKISRKMTKRFARSIKTIAQYVRYSSISDQQLPLQLPDLVDHDELKTISNAINEKNAKILSQVQVMQDFISHVQHEFKTPLTSLTLTNEIGLEDPETKNLAEENLRYSQQLNRIIDALLLFVEVDTANKNLEKCDIENMAKDIASQLEKKHQSARNITIEKNGSGLLYIHKGTLETILINLIDNARKYSNIDTDITIKIDDQGLSISDQGVGIDHEEQKMIWTPFWQSDRSKSIDSGLGLGLAIVKKYADYRGRKITVQSNPKTGTTFYLKR